MHERTYMHILYNIKRPYGLSLSKSIKNDAELSISRYLPKTMCDGLLDSLQCDIRTTGISMVLLPDTYKCGLRIGRECQERFPRHCGLAIPACTTARA